MAIHNSHAQLRSIYQFPISYRNSHTKAKGPHLPQQVQSRKKEIDSSHQCNYEGRLARPFVTSYKMPAPVWNPILLGTQFLVSPQNHWSCQNSLYLDNKFNNAIVHPNYSKTVQTVLFSATYKMWPKHHFSSMGPKSNRSP